MREDKIKTIIVEDVLEAQDLLKQIIHTHFSNIEIMGCAESVSEAVTLIKKEAPELILMDIELTDGDAFGIFQQLPRQEFEVIFITAHANMLQKALDHYAFSYIVKPVEEQKLVAAIQRYVQLKQRMFSQQNQQLLRDFLQPSSSRLLLQTGNEHVSVQLADVIKCEADGNFTHFYLKGDQKYMVSKPLKYFDDLLSEKRFFRARRSVLVNIDCIASIYKKETIVLNNGDKVHVSARNKSKLGELIQYFS